MRFSCLTGCIVATFLFCGCQSTSCTQPGCQKNQSSKADLLTMADLVRMNRCELEDLYRNAGPGHAPCGVVDGRAIINPGTTLTVPAAAVTRLIWQGKVFTSDNMMVNRVLGLRAIRAKVFVGESWLDGKQSLILDYAETSKFFSATRDEVREIAPGLYLGIAYKRKSDGPEVSKFFTLDSRRN
jgi:hypothetical protein